jgi:DNA-binding transcriptional ArsR family regulator
VLCRQLAIAKTALADLMLIVSIGISIVMSAVAVHMTLSGGGMYMMASNTQSEMPLRDPADSLREAPPASSSGEGAPTGSYAAPQANLVVATSSSIYEYSPYILPVTFGAVAAALIWRGKVRSAWCKQGYDYETFRLVARMRGSPIRVKLLNSVATAKNRLQLANELDVDWKTIDNHMEILTRSGLVEEKAVVGTTRYYVLKEHGRRILLLLAEGEDRPACPKITENAPMGAPIH